jgi:disulfide oxidoreductase YuzD
MATYQIAARRTTTEVGYLFIEADTPEEALEEMQDNIKQDAAGYFAPVEIVEEQLDLEEGKAPEKIDGIAQ